MPLRLALGVLLGIVAVYGLIKALPLIQGPEIHVQSLVADPDTGFTTLSGMALHTETLTLDGTTLLIDEHGRFEKTLSLPRGGAFLTLQATDRFGRSSHLTREVIIP